MFRFYDGNQTEITDRTAIGAAGGFTAADLIALGEVEASAIARHLWERAQLVSNEFAHYLAVWSVGAGDAGPPPLALARFKKTGTYMLMIGTTVVASGRSLSHVLPTLLSCAVTRGGDLSAAAD